MPRMKWRRKHGYWYLKRQGERRKLAELFLVPTGWLVCILPGTFAGPYGSFDVARRAAESRSCR
jgi:hypothetical protein